MKKNIIRSLGASTAVVIAVAGVGTASASAQSYTNPGQGSYGYNTRLEMRRPHRHLLTPRSVTINNNINVADVRVNNDVSQNARTGNATVTGGRFGSTAFSGDATNTSDIGTEVNVNQ